MGVGSQRRELTGLAPVDSWKKIRAQAPGLMLFANLGITQLAQATQGQIQSIIGTLSAEAIAIHLNPLQEALQPEGTPHFKGAFQALEKLTQDVKIPVILKETGCGFSPKTLKKISQLKLAAVDVSGLGGTHWGRIEGARSTAQSKYSLASETFANWGESTFDSVKEAALILSQSPRPEIWASGGVRSGLDAAKCVALGAHRVGFAKPALEAALQGMEALDEWMALQEFELKVTLFCTDCKSPQELRQKERSWKTKET